MKRGVYVAVQEHQVAVGILQTLVIGQVPDQLLPVGPGAGKQVYEELIDRESIEGGARVLRIGHRAGASEPPPPSIR